MLTLLRPFLPFFLVAAVWSGPFLLAGDLRGRVILNREVTLKQPPRYYRGPYRSQRTIGATKESGPENVVVWLEGIEGSFEPPSKPAVMLQENEAFVPHVLPILSGTPVEFPNRDNFYHNVFSVVSGDRFDLGRYAEGKSEQEILIKPGVVVVRCEIHSDMKAYIVVLENPYFSVPDESGNFQIKDIPAGTYTVKAWHPKKGGLEQRVVFEDSSPVEITLTF